MITDCARAVQDIRPDKDLVLDVVLFLWGKCKLVFQRAQARLYDPPCYISKMTFPDKVIKYAIVMYYFVLTTTYFN